MGIKLTLLTAFIACLFLMSFRGEKKKKVVFFGDSIPRDRVDLANAAVDAADGLLCIGTSLAVHSAFQLVKRASEKGIPVAILNVGRTRAEKEQLEVTKIESPIGETLHALLNILERKK